MPQSAVVIFPDAPRNGALTRRLGAAAASLGALGCSALVITPPLLGSAIGAGVLAIGAGVLAVGVLYRFVRLRRQRPANPQQ